MTVSTLLYIAVKYNATFKIHYDEPNGQFVVSVRSYHPETGPKHRDILVSRKILEEFGDLESEKYSELMDRYIADKLSEMFLETDS